MRTRRLPAAVWFINPLRRPTGACTAGIMDQHSIVVRTAELIETEIDGEMVALDVERGTCLGFNSTASRIWALIEEPRTLSAIVDRLAEEFDVDAAQCARDVEALLADLREQGLVRLTPPAASAG